MIVHQKRSSTGDVGYKLKQRGYELDVKRPVFGEALPDNMDNHDLAVIYGGPPSANDNLERGLRAHYQLQVLCHRIQEEESQALPKTAERSQTQAGIATKKRKTLSSHRRAGAI